jgi:putative membrane protein
MAMTRMKMLAAVMMVAMGVCLSGLSAVADDAKESRNSGDKEFVNKASACGLAEVNLSQLAVRFAQNASVKQFAQRLIADHNRANQELTQFANRRSIPLAKTMNEKHQKLYDKLTKMTGKDFDQTYMEAMVKDNEEAVKLFEKESKDGKDEAMKAWAGKLTPILKRHLEKSREICKQTKGETKQSKH